MFNEKTKVKREGFRMLENVYLIELKRYIETFWNEDISLGKWLVQ